MTCDDCMTGDEWAMFGSGFELMMGSHHIQGEIMVFSKLASGVTQKAEYKKRP